ncbi:MAG: hypothetical protein IJ086_05700 [Clostridium sp.]|nr:hypothetical protein [Clostridium sp.]
MDNKKHSDNYVKAVCTMISRGDIVSIDVLKSYLKYIDLNTPVKTSYLEMDMLLGVNNLSELNPKYYGYSSEYNGNKLNYPIDLIIYSCIYNNSYYYHKRRLLEDILKLDDVDFGVIAKSLEYAISNGDLELFRVFMKLNPNFNAVSGYLTTGEEYSVFDNCLSLALARLTIGSEETFNNYPKAILEELMLVDDKNIDFKLMKSTRAIAKVLVDMGELEGMYLTLNNEGENLFEDIRLVVENYRNYIINKYKQ